MDIESLALSLTTAGELLVGYAVIKVHSRLSKEHKIDSAVVNEIKREKVVAALAMSLIFLGFLLKILDNLSLIY